MIKNVIGLKNVIVGVICVLVGIIVWRNERELLLKFCFGGNFKSLCWWSKIVMVIKLVYNDVVVVYVVFVVLVLNIVIMR